MYAFILVRRWMLNLVLGVIIFILLGAIYRIPHRPVYKNRDFWEKTGDVVWEVRTVRKQIALTFDDGPSPTFTGQILDLLKQYDAKVTFFVIGERAEAYPKELRRQFLEGHEIGNHTYKHREVNKLSAAELKEDLVRAQQGIQKIVPAKIRLFRPTSGYYDEKVVKAAKAMNYSVIIWTWGQDTRDWTNQQGWKIAQKVIRSVKPGDIVLFHDQGGDRSNTIEALRIILPALTAKGYRFITVSELMRDYQITGPDGLGD
jgi:polysaccharide deacetylase family sporulation protein PdaB